MPDSDTLAGRLSRLIALSGLDLIEVDALAGLRSLGHTGQIARGTKVAPKASTVTALARVLGTSAEYLVNGRGKSPAREDVCAAVERAERRMRRHAAKVAVNATPSTRRSRSAARPSSASD
jgi:hypothetical protein